MQSFETEMNNDALIEATFACIQCSSLMLKITRVLIFQSKVFQSLLF